MDKPNVKQALIGLDMVHTELWLMLKKMKDTNASSMVANKTSIECMELLVRAAMKDLGFEGFQGEKK